MGANAQTSVPAFTSGQVLTAAQVTQINTGIPVFASSTERDAAFGGTGEKTLAEGQYAFLEDTNETQYYDGSSWTALGGGGKILQVVTATYSTEETTTSAAYVDTSLTATITPTDATSTVMVFVNVPVQCEKSASQNSGGHLLAVERGGSQLASTIARYDDSAGTSNRDIYGTSSLMYMDSPATTSATTYTVQHAQEQSGTAYTFVNNLIGTLTLMEVSA